MEISLNELSCEPVSRDQLSARECMSRLVAVIRLLAEHGVQRTLRTLKTFMYQPLASNYIVAQWMNDRGVEHDERVFFKTIAAKAPHLEDIFYEHQEEQKQVVECSHNGKPAIGLGVGYLLDIPTVSLRFNPEFLSDPVEIHVSSLDERGNESNQAVSVSCLSDVRQVEARATWLKARVDREKTAEDGADLWSKRSLICPHINFGENVERQVMAMNGGEKHFRQVVRHLIALNNAVREWESGEFSVPGILWSYESTSTMNNGALADMRKFRFSDGEIRVCEPHTKVLGANIRIHFVPDCTLKRAYVGYIGPHLPTAGH